MSRGARGVAAAFLCALALGLASAPCAASSARYCDEPAALSAGQKDTLFRFAALIKDELEGSGAAVALVSRSGLDLERFGMRYTHAGLALKTGLSTPWAVRQLYYACDERRPRVFDQGLSAFLFGLNDPAAGFVSVVLMPEAPGAALARAALDRGQALALLGATYSANAYAFSARYQNCNQWVAEMLAAAWGDLDAASGAEPPVPRPDDAPAPRAQAQRWLQQQGYRPTTFELGPLWMGLASFVPWLHRDDHPGDDLEGQRFRVSMPAALEGFVQATIPGATRIEFCHAGRRVVVRRGWDALGPGCMAGPGDREIRLD